MKLIDIAEGNTPSGKALMASSDIEVFAKYGLRRADQLKLAMSYLRQGYAHDVAAEMTKKKLGLNEANLFESIKDKIKALPIEKVIELAGYCETGDDLSKLERAKERSIEEVTDDQDGNVVVVIRFFYSRSAYIANIVFDKAETVIAVDVSKDANYFGR